MKCFVFFIARCFLSDMYGVQTDDIVNGYDTDDRPISRIGYRGDAPVNPAVHPSNDNSDDDYDEDNDFSGSTNHQSYSGRGVGRR